MASTLDSLLEAVKGAVSDHATQQKNTGFDTNGLINKISDLFGNHQQQQVGGRNVRPASEDPYGDPADQAGQGAMGKVKPASEDPYGDPADQEARRR